MLLWWLFCVYEIVPLHSLELLLITSNGYHATLHILLLIRSLSLLTHCTTFLIQILLTLCTSNNSWFLILQNLSKITIEGLAGKTRLAFYFNGSFVRSILMHVVCWLRGSARHRLMYRNTLKLIGKCFISFFLFVFTLVNTFLMADDGE